MERVRRLLGRCGKQGRRWGPPDFPGEPTHNAEAVPTTVTIGPDGAIYVGELKGFPFRPGSSNIWRIKPNADGAWCSVNAPDPTRKCSLWKTGFTAVQDIGKAIHPVLAAGQIEGGTAQGLGYALLEEVVMADGRMANAQMTNYTAPTTLDTPPMDVVIVESPYRHGPFGAKGVGEMPIDGVAPAVVNAIRHTGLDVRSIPATPERILQACASR